MGMSLYKDYVKEREGLETLESPHGFALYKIKDNECYIQDIFVDRMHRRSGIAAEMADKVADMAKEQGCIWLVGSVDTRAKGSDTSIKVLLAYGMKFSTAKGDMLYFVKGI